MSLFLTWRLQPDSLWLTTNTYSVVLKDGTHFSGCPPHPYNFPASHTCLPCVSLTRLPQPAAEFATAQLTCLLLVCPTQSINISLASMAARKKGDPLMAGCALQGHLFHWTGIPRHDSGHYHLENETAQSPADLSLDGHRVIVPIAGVLSIPSKFHTQSFRT